MLEKRREQNVAKLLNVKILGIGMDLYESFGPMNSPNDIASM